MRIHHLLLIASVLIIVGCAGHGSQPVAPNPPQNPVAVAKADPNPQAINIPISFSGSDSYDPDGGDIQLFEWDWNNDGTYDEKGENVDHTWSEFGTYLIQLRVTDDEGQVDILDKPFSVVIASVNPVAVANTDLNPQTINLPVSFSGSDSYDPDGGDIQLFEWDWDNNGTYDETGENLDHTWNELGTFFVQLRVTDDEDMTDILDEPLQVVVSGSGHGNLIWAKHDGSLHVQDGNGITALSDNSVVVTGEFDGTVTLGIGEANETQLVSVDSTTDFFIARYNSDGSLAWAKSAGGPSSDRGLAITALSDDSVVVTGHFLESMTLGSGETNATHLVASDDYDIFIARYNVDGSLAWAKRASPDRSYAITTLSDNSTVMAGVFYETATFGQYEPNQTNLVAFYEHDFFIARYDADDGSLVWAKSVGWVGLARVHDITTLSDNSTVMTGWFNGTAYFGWDGPNVTELVSTGEADIFVARCNTDGSLAWAKRAGGGSDDLGRGITTLSDDSTVVTGDFEYTATFGPDEPNETQLVSDGASDFFIARFNTDGSLTWVKRAGGPNDNYGLDITTLSDDSTVATGKIYGTIIFGPGEPNETQLVSANTHNNFIARYNADDGSLAWAKSAGRSLDSPGLAITTLSDNSTVVTGNFSGTAIFGLGEPNETQLVATEYDIFIARFEP